MDAMELLSTRASNGKLGEPAPDDATLRSILDDALRAPDHGAIRPWRIFVLRGEARERLGDLFATLVTGDAEKIERERRKPLRAPLLLVVAAAPEPRPGVPEIEQILSAGVLAHGILLGLHARGFAGMWRTGEPAYDARVKQALGLRPQDHIVGFVYAGTASAPFPVVKRPHAAEHAVEWMEPGRTEPLR